MQQKKLYDPLQIAEAQILLAKFDSFQSRLKKSRLKGFWLINQMRIICRQINIDSVVPLNKSDTERMDLAMKKAIEEDNPIVDHILNCEKVIVIQDKTIFEKDSEIRLLQDEIQRLKNSTL